MHILTCSANGDGGSRADVKKETHFPQQIDLLLLISSLVLVNPFCLFIFLSLDKQIVKTIFIIYNLRSENLYTFQNAKYTTLHILKTITKTCKTFLRLNMT